jgi:hypothetical protein
LQKAGLMISKLQDRKPVQELATNPLLLTLLCLIFGDESDFPSNRSELYKEGLDVLLKKWDGKRYIERDQVYKKLSLKRKEDLLSRLAFDTFDKGEYFFKKSTAERYIADYIQNIPGASDDDLQLDSEAVLKSIMAQHGLLVERASGIFSFSHLTFHEYFAAKRIVDSSIAQGVQAFQKFAGHANDKRWKEVFFLVLGMLPDASSCLLIIKQEIDGMLAGDERLQEYLVWLDEKCQLSSYENLMQDRLFYMQYHDYDLEEGMTERAALEYSLDYALTLILNEAYIEDYDHVEYSLGLACDLNQSSELIHDLKELCQLLSNRNATTPGLTKGDFEKYRQQLRGVIIRDYNIGHNWQLTKNQQDNLEKYYFANRLLREFLEAEDECYLTLSTRQYITDTFCRPFHLIPPV